ncbi:hypothetical protein [Catelliglobosispora koreensis]|uniref:hypothetical protein n=1 Tax=Catelliglobosispora koreensis TaxID=129052 RepID=UPI0012F7D366|nr:hypothetical protein [Catelliglobosispora koreensis]
MSIRVIEDVPAGRLPLQMVVRFLSVLLGIGFLLTGLLLAIWPVMALVIAVDNLVRPGESSEMSDSELVWTAVVTLGAVISTWFGVLLLRGRRQLGLYLRKFGFADTTQTVSHALRSAVGRSVRLVTLDDAMAAPVGVGAGKWIVGLMQLVGLAFAGVMLYSLLRLDEESIIRDTMEQATSSADDNVVDQFGAALGGALVGGMVAGFALIFLLTLTIIGGLVGLFAYRAYKSAKQAQEEARQALVQRQQVGPVAKKLQAVARKVFAPRLIVVAVPGSFWQQAVSGFASVSRVAIMDVSHPTDPLLWEIQTLKPLFGERLIYVGSREHVLALTRPAHEIAGTPTGLLAQLLDGSEIIAYGQTWPQRRRFAKALRRRIANSKAI